jgi:hypothetical protein
MDRIMENMKKDREELEAEKYHWIRTPKSCIGHLCKHLENEYAALQHLFLNNCKITDGSAIALIDNLLHFLNMTMTKLYLNYNLLTDKTGSKVAELFAAGSTNIRELGLKSNRLTAISGNEIATALWDNREVKILDLSWNVLGIRPKDKKVMGKIKKLMKRGEIGKVWGQFFHDNECMVHLDLSFNKIEQFESEKMIENTMMN